MYTQYTSVFVRCSSQARTKYSFQRRSTQNLLQQAIEWLQTRIPFISSIGITLSLAIILTGCVSTKTITDSIPIESESKLPILVTQQIAHWMKPRDNQRLYDFVDRAKPQAQITWKRHLTTYTLNSESIFLNDFGQPCRTYEVKRTSFLSQEMRFQEVACRNMSGRWERQLVK